MVTSLSDNDKQLIAMMDAAETALKAGDFTKSKEEFYRLLQIPSLPSGGPTAWPHRVPKSMLEGSFDPEPHLPTNGDVLLGLGLSALGLGDFDVARQYIDQSGFWVLRQQFLESIRAHATRRREQSSEPPRHFTREEVLEEEERRKGQLFAEIKSPEGTFQRSGFPREAAKSAIRQSYDWAMRGDWLRVKRLFEFLWKLLGVTYGDSAFDEIRTCAYRAQGEHFGIAAFYFFQTIRFEPTFCSNAIEGILRCAQGLIQQGHLREAEELLEQTKSIPVAELNEDWGMDISEDIERCKSHIQYVYGELRKATTDYDTVPPKEADE